MRTFFLLITALLLSTCICSAQEPRLDTIPSENTQIMPQNNSTKPILDSVPPKSKFDRSKLVLGGGFGLSFGTDYTAFTIAPQVGYAFNKYITAGIGLNYSYYDYWRQSQNYLGMNVYTRLTPIKYIAFQAQPEIYRLWGSGIGSRTVPCMLVGAGMIMPAGRGGFQAMIYYDAAQNAWSPYGNRMFYSVGYIIGF